VRTWRGTSGTWQYIPTTARHLGGAEVGYMVGYSFAPTWRPPSTARARFVARELPPLARLKAT
jgi:hypothetical protein